MNIPADFPRDCGVASLADALTPLAVRRDATTGTQTDDASEAEVQVRYEICPDLVAQLVAKCQKNRETKYVALSEVQILERLLAQLLGTQWGSDAEMRWVIRRAAFELGWAIPESAAALRTMLGEV